MVVREKCDVREPPPSWVAPAQTLSVKSVGAFLMKTRSGRGKYALI